MQQDPKNRYDGDLDRFEQRDSVSTMQDATNGQITASQNLAVQGEDDDEIASNEMTGNDRLEPSLEDEDDEDAAFPLPDETFNRGSQGSNNH